MKRPLVVVAALLALTAAALALADHMSPDGIGTASMPNDIHNTRLDVRLSDALNECFTDLVQQGDLADVDNRCDSDDPTDCVIYTVTADCTFVPPE